MMGANSRRECASTIMDGLVLLRADAGREIGTGHVMRCLALAEALMDDGISCALAAAMLPDTLAARLTDQGVAVHRIDAIPGGADDLAQTVLLRGRLGARAVVVDGYRFGTDWRARLRAEAPCVLAFDDLAAGRLHADVVVNAAPEANRLPYADLAQGAEILAGPAYAPLRREIRETIRAPMLPVAERHAVLVSFGGSDPLGLTAPCATALAQALPQVNRFDVVVGGANPRIEAVMAAAAAFPGRVAVHIDVRCMGRLMASAGLAVSAAGTTTAELAAVGVPSLLVVVAGNQQEAARQAGEAAWCEIVDGGAPNAIDRVVTAAAALWDNPTHRQTMTMRARTLVDGNGALRIAAALRRRMAGHDALSVH